MSLTKLKDEAARLAPKEQRELIGCLVALETERDDAFKGRLAAKIDDRDSAHWRELNELKKRYGQ